MTRNSFLKKILEILMLILIVMVGCYAWKTYQSSHPSADVVALFDLGHKVSTTKLFYSDTLGVGFTYDSQPGYGQVNALEKGNTIYVYLTDEPIYNKPEEGASVEVFTKNPDISLEQALKEEILGAYDSSVCHIGTRTYTGTYQHLNYISASFLITTEVDGLGELTKEIRKCPPGAENYFYGHFLMNPEVPGKFVYVKRGQDQITSNGTPISSDSSSLQGSGWDDSIRILEQSR